MIQQQEKNIDADTEDIDALKQKLTTMIPDEAKHEQAEKRILSATILTEVKFSSRNEALQNKTRTSRNVLPFITTLNPATPNLKKILMKHWHLITESYRLGQIYSEPPIAAYRKDKSLKDLPVRAKIPSHN